MASEIVFKEKDEALFWNAWEECVAATQAGPRYLKSSIEYDLARSETLEIDKSFVYFLNNKAAVSVFLPIEKHEDIRIAAFQGGYLDAPLFCDAAAQKAVFSLHNVSCRLPI